MSKYRERLPQLFDQLFLTDSGLETTLIFKDGIDLPEFAACALLLDEEGRQILREYFLRHAHTALEHKTGFILESVTWRASSDWGTKLGYTDEELDKINRRAITDLLAIREECETPSTPMVVSGCVGPRGDGYVPGQKMTADEAQEYHARQINILRDAGADMVSAFTINYVEEALGIVRAAQAAGIPVVISFTLETDGKLPTGQTLQAAIEEVDGATSSAPAYYMINCAHPTHFDDVLSSGGTWLERIRGIRANASTKSHAELDESVELDDGDQHELGQQYVELKSKLINLTVMGGCCGTDHRHVEAICRSVVSA